MILGNLSHSIAILDSDLSRRIYLVAWCNVTSHYFLLMSRCELACSSDDAVTTAVKVGFEQTFKKRSTNIL